MLVIESKLCSISVTRKIYDVCRINDLRTFIVPRVIGIFPALCPLHINLIKYYLASKFCQHEKLDEIMLKKQQKCSFSITITILHTGNILNLYYNLLQNLCYFLLFFLRGSTCFEKLENTRFANK